MERNVHWLFEAQKSPEFGSLLQLVAESEVYGEPKFTPRICRELGRLLVCRAYAPAILELCHLVAIANACGPPDAADLVERFFWGSGPARPGSFRAFVLEQSQLSNWNQSGFTSTDAGVEISSNDIVFSVTYSRMPLLSALLEFLVSAIGYLELDETLQGITNQPLSKKTISDNANRLSRQLYDFLKHHLPTAQEQRKFHRLINFMTHTQPEGFDHLSIDDGLLLKFWLQESIRAAVDGLDFKTFPTVFKLFVHLRRTLEQVKVLRGMDSARSIGGDREAGEIDPGEVLQIVETIDSPTNPLHDLQVPPAREIKFLNNKELARLEQLVNSGSTAHPLALSLLRCEAFEPLRKRLTQALRDKASPKQICNIIMEDSMDNYLQLQALLSKDLEHAQRALLASMHVLLSSQHQDAVSLALELQPDLDLSFLSGEGNSSSMETLQESFFNHAGTESPTINPLSQLAVDAHRAFNKIARKGFGKEDMAQPVIIEGFAAGSNAINKIRKQLEHFLSTLIEYQPPSVNWQQQFEADKEIFSKQFHILYGKADSIPAPERE